MSLTPALARAPALVPAHLSTSQHIYISAHVHVWQLAAANATIATLQRKLDASIDQNDVSGFVQSLHDIDQNGLIEQKDRTLLEHLAQRLRYKRGSRHGAIEGIMRDMQDLLVDKLGRQDYTLVASILHLSSFEKAAASRNRDELTFCVGMNEHILEVSRPRVPDPLTLLWQLPLPLARH